jgi:excisionase family DNA binding protein
MTITQTAIAIGPDLGTVPWAAETLNLSQRHVRRLLRDGKLKTVRPRRGSTESQNRCTLVFVDEVLEYKRARQVVAGE